MRLLRALAIAIICQLVVTAAAAQGPAAGSQQTKKDVVSAGNQGIPLNTDLTVRANVTVEAVLIPAKVSSRVFGKEIGDNYAVIALTITNKSSDAALIIQGAYIDYAAWGLSGSVSGPPCVRGRGEANKDIYQVCTQPSQVASVEYRIVRGELLDASNWTARNTVVRLLTLIGAAASASTFAISEQAAIQGITAFTGNVIPGVSTFWPDQTVAQLNRISDFGFQTNKIIPKQGSDIIVCFFPIDRFLTESYRKLFVRNPAVFFSPLEAFVDKQVREQILSGLPDYVFQEDGQPGSKKEAREREETKLLRAVPCYLRRLQEEQEENETHAETSDEGNKRSGTPPVSADTTQNPPAGVQQSADTAGKIPNKGAQQPGTLKDVADQYCQGKPGPTEIVLLDFIRRMSLNTIRIVVDGVMSVETTTLPAKIVSISFDKEADWTDTTSVKKGTIAGAYLTGGVPNIQNADDLGITDVTGISDGSDDQNLQFSLKLTNPFKAEKKLTFIVEKKTKDGTPVTSAPFEYDVQYAPAPPPKIDSIKFDDSPDWADIATAKTGIITGSDLTGGVPKAQNAAAVGVTDLTAVTQGSDDHNLHFSFKTANPIIAETKVQFTVEKTAKDGTVISSAPSECTIGPKAPQPAPSPQQKGKSTSPQSPAVSNKGKSASGQVPNPQKDLNKKPSKDNSH